MPPKCRGLVIIQSVKSHQDSAEEASAIKLHCKPCLGVSELVTFFRCQLSLPGIKSCKIANMTVDLITWPFIAQGAELR